ncbi:MAG: hypothetical protein FJW36_21795 [Acidobacteria bacterium]|nr:hypothetical protein [Acidobacteriota bacterium]
MISKEDVSMPVSEQQFSNTRSQWQKAQDWFFDEGDSGRCPGPAFWLTFAAWGIGILFRGSAFGIAVELLTSEFGKWSEVKISTATFGMMAELVALFVVALATIAYFLKIVSESEEVSKRNHLSWALGGSVFCAVWYFNQ